MAGKGSAPRNCFSQVFRDNHDSIDWSKGRRAPVKPDPTDILIKDYTKPTEWVIPSLEEILGRPQPPPQ